MLGMKVVKKQLYVAKQSFRVVVASRQFFCVALTGLELINFVVLHNKFDNQKVLTCQC